MKRLLIFIAVIVLAASLGAQSLAELAKREKARREGFKGRPVVLVKNADLLRVQKVPGVEVAKPEEPAAEAQDVAPETVSSEAESAATPSGSGAPSGRRINPRVSNPGPDLMGENAAGVQTASRGAAALEAQLKAAQELVDLLATKMSALRQQYEYQDTMVPGYVIQQQMDETNQRLVKAQAQEARIRAEMQQKGLAAKKDAGSVDR